MLLESPIKTVEALVFRYPIDIPIATSFGFMRDRPAVFVRVEDADGAVGWGEAWCNFPQVGAEHRARLIGSLLAPLLAGKRFPSPANAFQLMNAQTAVMTIQTGETGPIAQSIAAVDIALWDLAARRAGEPLWRFLGGASPQLKVYGSAINPTEPERTVEGAWKAGHRAFKLKVGFGLDRDRANLNAIRQLLGTNIPIAVDANQAWDLDHAQTAATALEEFGLAWLEEPLRADRPWAEWETIAQASAIPLSAGENLIGVESFDAAIASKTLRIVQPDIAKWGGFSGCIPVAKAIIDAGLSYYPHYLAGGIGLLASAHLLSATGGQGLLEVDVNPNALREQYCGPVGDIVDGYIELGTEPGLGLEPDFGKISAFRVYSADL